MALGEKLFESSGTMIGTRLLPSDARGDKAEMSFRGSGSVLGMEMTEMATCWRTVEPGGEIHIEGQLLLTTSEGETARWTCFGVGSATGPTLAARFGVCGTVQTTSRALARLTTVAIVTELEVNEDGTYHCQSWEWK